MAELELTERELAIIEGRDPNDAVVVDDEQSSTQDSDQDAVDQNNDLDNEPIDQSGDTDEEGSQDDKDVADTSGSKDAASESVSGSGGKPSTQSWLDDSVRQLGRSLDFSDEEMAEFGSRAEFDRATRFIAKRFSGQRQQQADSRQQTTTQQSGQQQAVTQAPPPSGEQSQSGDPLAAIDPEKWREAGYDDRTIELVRSHRELLQRQSANEQVLANILRGAQQKEFENFISAFHSELDRREESLFGRSVKDDKLVDLRNTPADANRARVWEAYHVLKNGIEQRARELGRQPEMPSHGALMDQAIRVALGDELSKLEKARFHDKVREQSRRRRPAATQRIATNGTRSSAKNAAQTVTTTTDQIEDLLDNPELKAMYERFQEDNS